MTTRTATLLAAVATLSLAAPFTAQAQGRDPVYRQQPAIDAAADAAEQAAAEAAAQGRVLPGSVGRVAAPAAAQPAAWPTVQPGPQVGYQRLGYSVEQREAWLAECRANHAPADRRQGGLIGGLLGAVVGGIAGNRIADGARLGGTLIGAGVGGLAGAAIGGAIDRADARRDAQRDGAADYCEQYLSRYEGSAYAQPATAYAYSPAQVQGYAAPTAMVPIMLMPVPMQLAPAQYAPAQQYEQVEEWDEVVAPVRYVRTRTHVAAPRPGKLVPVRRGKLLPAK